MPDQNHGGIVISIQMKALQLIQSPLHIIYSNQYLNQHIWSRIPLPVLTSFLLTNPVWWLIVEPIHLFIQTVIIKLFIVIQILKLSILHPIREKRSNIDSIRKAIKMIDQHFMFMNKTVHEQVTIFNTILMNILSNYIPNKYIIIDDQDPPQMTKAIKDKINL